MPIKRILLLLLACVLLLNTFGCRAQDRDKPGTGIDAPVKTPSPADSTPEPDDNYTPSGNMVSIENLTRELREKYADSEMVDYRESLWDVPKDREFFIDLAFDLVEDTDYTSFAEVFAVYTDAEMTQTVSASWEIQTHEDDSSIPEGHNRVYIRPGRTAAGRVWGSYNDLVTREKVTLNESGDYYLHEQSEYESWGFLKHYYLVQHIDPVTAETLERPPVTIFTLENRLEAPLSEFYVTDDGRAAFRWKHIIGADYYLIIEIDEFSVAWPIDRVGGTSWEYPHSPDSVAMNRQFSVSGLTDDDMMNMTNNTERAELVFKNYSVIAVNSSVHSPVGSIHRGEDIAARLPSRLAWNTNRQDAGEAGGNTKFIPAVGLLPTHRAIVMANGSIAYRRMIYDFSFAEIKEDRWIDHDGIDSNGELINPRFVEHTNLYINYVIEGTIFKDTMVVTGVDLETAMSELEEFRQMVENSSSRGGGSIETEFETAPKNDNSRTSEDARSEILDTTGDRVFANSALSEYFALNLIAVNEMIDLSGFPESADWEYLLDAFFEALYQNPLALHIESAFSIPGTELLIVEYRETARKIHGQQTALREIVPQIVAEIIAPDMSDLEKSFAINNYLINNSEYDWEALKEAERNDFQFVDSKFNDSFTAYGILINKIGVCAGYADAYKLLADAAGLDAVIITGFMEGVLPHAWNRVNIDGHWHTVDVTNNANEFLLNAFLNLPDSAAGRLLIEDNQFMMNDFIPEYRSTDNTSEYYYVTGRLFEKTEVAEELARQLRQNGSVTLRTDYDLDDDEFYEIAMDVLELLGIQELFGFYMLGVIWMSQ